ncbi:MAG: hypothetical protein L0154_00920 [Chloroflexi bacterium]|nr:hypothetical protein [Chloroflexota bacterium]
MSNMRDAGHDVSVEEIDDGDIIIFRLANQSRESIDAWTEEVIRYNERYQDKIAYIHDLTRPKLALTSYGRKRIKDMNANRENRGHVGVVMPHGPIVAVARFFLNREIFAMQPNVEIRLFYEMDEALAWLRERVAERKRSQ